MKFGLEGISRLLRGLGDPQKQFRAIHVAGTNGKGSVASMLAAIFTAAGYKTGLYTSPHLERFEERIRIDGKPVPQRSVASLVTTLRPSLRKFKPTFFEATTALAFTYFAKSNVDIAIVETGLGGRLDSTNVLRPCLTIITGISLEHTEILGNTIEEIAGEKAGIIKKGIPCVTGAVDAKAVKVFRRACRKQNTRLIVASAKTIAEKKCTLEGTQVDAVVGKSPLEDLVLSLPGHYQLRNLAVVLEAVNQVRASGDYTLADDSIREGLANVREFSGLTGRLTIMSKKPLAVVDVAHNAEATGQLVDTLQRLGFRKATVVFGVMKDKDHVGMIHSLAAITDHAVAVAARSARSRSASDVAATFAKEGCKVRAALSVQEGVRFAFESAPKKGLILVTGSHFVVGEAIPAFNRKRT
jgi:dihydrofolate synthase / folylpolyglutamate synthase